jgi:hypothetical protein
MAESVPDSEIASARVVFRELDKSSRATRTYGLANAVTKRFFDQLQSAMLAHLDRWPTLAVIVDRSELRLSEEVVYHGEESLGENVAFRLFGDGVREVLFEQGLSGDDLHSFLDALWGRAEEDEDDDVVTRLWAKDLATISFITAEDIIQAPSIEELKPQEHGFFATPPESFGAMIDRERTLAATASTASSQGPAAAGENLRRGGGLVGFEVNETERRALDKELADERTVDATSSVLAMLQAILHSERSPDLLARALATGPAALDALLAAGNWTAVDALLSTLERAVDANAAFELTHRLLAQRVIDSLNLPEPIALIEKGLNTDAGRTMTGLSRVFARLQPNAVGSLCNLLASLNDEEQRAALRDTLIRLGAENPEPVLKGLADPRAQYASDLVSIVVAWQQPQAKDELAMLAGHPAAEVREQAVKCIARLHPNGDAAPVMAFASDPDPEVRQHAMRLLASARYTATWEQWKPHLRDEVIEMPRADKRLLFQALGASAGNGAVPFFLELITERGWKQRQKREETALLAIKALAALGTDAARDALEFARTEGGGAVRKACAAALDGSGN